MENNQEIPKAIAGLMLSAIISDTVLFRSPTCTETDKENGSQIAEIAGVDIESYGLDMLKAGADISDLTNDDIVRTDMKESPKLVKRFLSVKFPLWTQQTYWLNKVN